MLGKTIAAISTPYGRGGVALIRISGEEAFSICDKVFMPRNGEKLSSQPARMAIYGDILSHGDIIDDGIATIFKAPFSYTGENTVEISCHGGIHLSQSVLESIILSGAEYADAGEFTQRAFLNGKLSLTEAESVINLIDAVTDEQIRLATSHRGGVLSKTADRIYNEMLKLVSSTYAYIDYPDEDLTDISVDELKTGLQSILSELNELESSYKTGHAVSEGIKTAIVGKPNAGKSSLLNAMLGEKRAIVTEIAGTTRDVIEESVRLRHIVLRLSDTAGIRNTDDEVEKIGVGLAYEKMLESELIIAVFDGSAELTSDDYDLVDYINKNCTDKKVIAVVNKSDLYQNADTKTYIEKSFSDVAVISTRESTARDALFELIESFFIKGEIDYNNKAVIANLRQFTAVKKAREYIENAITSLNGGFTQDVAGMDIENAMGFIGELDSRSVGEDVVKDIFGRFCVGK